MHLLCALCGRHFSTIVQLFEFRCNAKIRYTILSYFWSPDRRFAIAVFSCDAKDDFWWLHFFQYLRQNHQTPKSSCLWLSPRNSLYSKIDSRRPAAPFSVSNSAIHLQGQWTPFQSRKSLVQNTIESRLFSVQASAVKMPPLKSNRSRYEISKLFPIRKH